MNIVKESVKRLLAMGGKRLVPFQDPFRDMIRLLGVEETRLIIDGGAYHGDLALQFKRLFPGARVFAFEPCAKSYEVLMARTKGVANISSCRLALSSTNGTRTFHTTTYGQTSSLMPPGDAGKKYFPDRMITSGTETVEVVTLDDWTEREHISKIDLIKLDLEGHELEALRGCEKSVLPCTRSVYTEIRFVEIHRQCCEFTDLAQYLDAQGFALYNLYHLGSDPKDGQLLWGDALFVNRALVSGAV